MRDSSLRQAAKRVVIGAVAILSVGTMPAIADAGGPRFGLLSDRCSASFIQGYSSCLFRQTNCVAERLLLVQMPRARDLLTSAGITVGNAVGAQSCLLNEDGSGALGVDPKPGK